MMTDSLPSILTLLKVGAGGAADGFAAAAGAELAPVAGEAAAAGDAPGAAAAGEAAGAAGFAASVGFVSAAGLAVGAAGVAALPQAATIGRAAAASPRRSIERRERRWGIRPGEESSSESLKRHLLA